MSREDLSSRFRQSAHTLDRGRGFLLALAFMVLAAWFAWGSPQVSIPDHGTPPIDRTLITTQPMRQPISTPPAITVAGYQLGCMECHRLFSPPHSGIRGTPIQHKHIQLDHGMNIHCLNCHHPVDRNRLSVRGGPMLSFEEVPLLCAGCHGTTYRDWTRGIHGRTNGYWDSTSGTSERLICTHCHDPHAPAFAPMDVLPGPHTLRLEVLQHGASGVPHQLNPLRRFMHAPSDGFGTHHDLQTGGKH